MADKIKHSKQSTAFLKTKLFVNEDTGTIKNEKVISLIEFIVAVVLTLILFSLHFIFLLNAGPLWRDEVCTFNLANLPSVAQFWERLQYDSFPALWYFILKVWILIGFGVNDFAFLVKFTLSFSELFRSFRSSALRITMYNLCQNLSPPYQNTIFNFQFCNFQ